MSQPIRVALVEDQDITREGLSLLIGGSPGFEICGQYDSMEHALKEMMAGHTSEDLGGARLAAPGDAEVDEGEMGSFLNVISPGQNIAVGVVLIVAVGLDTYNRRRGS